MVKKTLRELKVAKPSVELGRASFFSSRKNVYQLVEKRLAAFGLPVIVDRNKILIESIRLEVKNYLDEIEAGIKNRRLSSFLQKRLARNYNLISKFFKDQEGVTLEFYVITQRIERAKRLIREDELSLKQIAEKLHYSSLQHLSAQFGKVTGLTATRFKEKNFNRTAYYSLVEVLEDLQERGYINQFRLQGSSLLYDQLYRVQLSQVSVKEAYRFDERK